MEDDVFDPDAKAWFADLIFWRPSKLSDEEMETHFWRFDGRWSAQTKANVSALGGNGLQLDSNWAFTHQRWSCPICGRPKSELFRISGAGVVLARLDRHHDHLKDTLWKRAFELFGEDWRDTDIPGRGDRMDAIETLLDRFKPCLICHECNAADGSAKKGIAGMDPRFSFAPAEIESQSKARDGRRTVDDVTTFDSMLGQARNAWLSTKGIELDDQVFHDQSITTDLLLRLTKHALTNGYHDKKLLRAKRIGVLVTTDRVDASYVMVWDPSTKRGVRLPNIKPEFTTGTSWRLIRRLKAFAEHENLAFHSEEEMIYARAELSRRLREVGFFPSFREARKFASDIDTSPALVPGDSVEVMEVSSEEDIPASNAAAFRDDSRRPSKGFNRAKSGKSKKRSATGKTGKVERRSPLDRPKAKAQDSPTAANLEASRDGPGGRCAETGMSDSDADAMMRELMNEMNQ